MGDKPLKFWLNICLKAYSQLSVFAVDLLTAPASQAFVERLFSVCGMLTHQTSKHWANVGFRLEGLEGKVRHWEDIGPMLEILRAYTGVIGRMFEIMRLANVHQTSIRCWISSAEHYNYALLLMFNVLISVCDCLKSYIYQYITV